MLAFADCTCTTFEKPPLLTNSIWCCIVRSCLLQAGFAPSHPNNRYILGDRFHDGPRTSGHKKPTCKFHNMGLCPEVTQYQSVVSELINSKIKTVRLQSSSPQNMQHYFFYNRLMDYWHNKTIITKQLQQMKAKLQQGETVVRDHLHRFVYVCSLCKTPGHTQQTCPQLPDCMSPQ